MSTIINTLKETQQKQKRSKETDSEVDLLPLGKEIKDHILKTSLLRSRLSLVVSGLVVLGLLSAGIFSLYQKFFTTEVNTAGQSVREQAFAGLPIQQGEEQSKDFVALNADGINFLNAGQISQAMACFEKAIGQQKMFPSPHNNLGIAYMQRGEIDKAIENFSRALQFRANYAEAHINIAVAYELKENYFEALSHYQKFIACAPPQYSDLKKKVRLRIGSN